MKIIDYILNKISQRKKPQEQSQITNITVPLEKVFTVPECDFLLLKFIRTSTAKKMIVTVNSFESLTDENYKNAAYYHNAKILHDFYGMDRQEVLQETGYWVEESNG